MIPIQNLYYLLCYSWNRLEEGQQVDVSNIDSTEVVDLFASVLLSGTRHILRRGLEQGYSAQSETIPGIRGRLDIASTSRRMLTAQGLAHCEFDELTVNTLPNQIIKSTLYHVSKVATLDSKLRQESLSLWRDLAGIETPVLSRSLFRLVQLHGNNRYYKFLLHVCELISSSLLIDESKGSYRFIDFQRDEKRMARVFEEFLFNFFKLERQDLTIRKEKIQWDVDGDGSTGNLGYLPSMETDISVRSKEKTLIIDAKYYQQTLSRYYETEKVHSANLYQLFAYLKNMEVRGGADERAAGMLLYPSTKGDYRLNYSIQGHTIRVCTVNLANSWSEIKTELHGLLVESGL